MRALRRWRRFHFGFAIAWLLIGGALLMLNAATSETAIVRMFQAHLQSELEAEVAFLAKCAQNPDSILNPEEFYALWDREGVQCLHFSERWDLKKWNTRDFAPSLAAIKHVGRYGNIHLLRDRNRHYYILQARAADSSRVVFLFPFRVDYPIDNEYLKDYQFVGKWGRLISPETAFAATLPTSETGPGVAQFSDPLTSGPWLALSVRDSYPFRQPVLIFAIASLALGICYGLFVLRGWLRRRFAKNGWVEVGLFGAAAAIRAAMLVFALPNAWVHTELFSPNILAINALNPSLGDFTLNSIFMLWLSALVYGYAPVGRLARLLMRMPAAALGALLVGVVGALAWLFGGFFGLFDSVVLNSQIYYEFADIYRLNAYSYIVFLNFALLLTAMFLVMHRLSGLVQAVAMRKASVSWLAFGAAVAVSSVWASSSMLQPGGDWSEWVVPMVFVSCLAAIYLVRQHVGASLRFGLLPALAIFTLFAGITNLAVSLSLEHSTRKTLVNVSNRFSEDKNLITESTFEGVVENIRNDSALWHNDTLTAQLENPFSMVISLMVNKHLLNSFKQYDIRVFVFSGRRRLDNQFDIVPFPLTEELMIKGRTLSNNLFFVPYRRSVTQNIYVGRAPVESHLYGRLILQIELHPKNYLAGRLYPQLLLDQSIRRKLTLPPDYALAIYVNNQLSRKEGNADFPLRTPFASDTLPRFLVQGGYNWLVHRVNEGKVVVVRAPERSLFDKLTAFSFLFYFFALIYLLLRMPDAVRFMRRSRFSLRNIDFATRIQLYLVLLTLLPLMAIWLLTTPLFERFYYDETQRELRSNLGQVANFLENEPSFLESLNLAQRTTDPTSVDLVSRISDILFADLNVFDATGKLVVSTRPKIFQMALASNYMNPHVLDRLARSNQPYQIVDEELGHLTYFSGYIPIVDAMAKVRGYVNIPFLSQQDALQDQIRRFIAYLINVYVVLILILVLASLLISKSITNPLRLLKQRLDDTQFGHRPEPLEWRSADEIGAIIDSYNRMLAKLDESEKRLAKSEREGAWREMARQVAHEIKNPLTPMKLTIQHLVRTLEGSEDAKTQRVAKKVSGTLLTQIDSLTAIANSFSQFATMADTKPEPTSLNRLLADMQQLYAETEGVRVALALPDEVATIFADPHQLSRVLVNLIRNAIQADATSLRLSLAVEKEVALVAVADNGKGIPKEIQDRIFEPNFSTKTSGMGLGLAISRRILENMNGAIWFVSEENAGTTFHLSFPLHAPEAPAP